MSRSFPVSAARKPAPRRTPLSRLVSLALAAMAASVGAQTEPSAPAPQQADEGAAQPGGRRAAAPQEPQTVTVTVTATRRREPVRDVPVQINTLSTESLERSGSRSLIDYLGNQPGVDVKTSGGAGLGGLNVRGVSTGDATIATVGVYIDDVPFGSSTAYASGSGTALDMELLDLDHIELLRGPQGTLYGAGAMGGLLKYVTHEPDTFELSGKVTLGASSTRHGAPGHTVSGVVNVPLKEEVAGLRISAFRDHVGGYVDAVGDAAGENINRGNTTGGRVSVLLEPSNRWKLRLSATTQEIKRESTDFVYHDAATGQPVDGALEHRISEREPYAIKTDVAAADLEYDLGWARFNSVTSGQRMRMSQRGDLSVVYVPLLSGLGFDIDRAVLDATTTVRKKTQEFRLTSQTKGSVQWLAGFFYNHETASSDQVLTSRLAADASPGPDLFTASLPTAYTESALYGDVTWMPARDWSVTGGLRVARNRQTYLQHADGPLAGGPADVDGRSSEYSRTYLGTVKYALDEVSNVYFRAASGYRPGGPNPLFRDATTGEPIAPPTFKHDELWSYELGYKADLLDKRLSVEASAFEIRWKDVQQFFAVNGVNVIVNAGRAQIDGAELALRYRPVTAWSVDGSLAVLDARLTEDAPGLGASGSRLPNSARFSASLGTTYNFEWAGASMYAGANLRYVGERNAGFDGSATLPNYKLPRYTLADVQAGAQMGRFQLGLYVRNLFDKRAQLNASTNLVPLGGPVQVTPAQPRTFGATLSASF